MYFDIDRRFETENIGIRIILFQSPKHMFWTFIVLPNIKNELKHMKFVVGSTKMVWTLLQMDNLDFSSIHNSFHR